MATGPVGEEVWVGNHLNIIRIPGAELTGSPYAGFVFGTFVMSLRRWGGLLERETRNPGSIVLIAQPSQGESSDVFVGWLAANPVENRIICAFTKAAYRASPEQRAGHEYNLDSFRIASCLALVAGIDFQRPVSCSFWSRAARAIAEKSGNPYNLRFHAPENR